jgi:hypothetical protein
MKLQKIHTGPQERNRQTNVVAASASTFSRNWQAPPPLIQFKPASTLQAFHIVTAHMDVILDLLIRSVDGDIKI